jgi:putative ABC transport system permease protein
VIHLLAELLRTLTRPHWVEHWVRTALTVVGVALGASTIVAVADISASVLASFRHAVATLSGDGDLEVTREGSLVEEALAERAAEVPGVAVAAGLVESFLPLADHASESVYLLGVDFLESPVWRTQLPRERIDIPDTLEFLARGDSAVVSRALAQRHGIDLGDGLAVVTPSGAATLRVRGILADVPAARLFDGAVVLMDLPRAQRLLGRADRVDRVVLQVAPGEAVSAVRAQVAAALGPGVEVAEPEARGEQAERLLFSLRSMLVVAGSLAVIVGAIIVYQAVAVSVQQRRRQFALLNAVGVHRRTLVTTCLLETAVLAVAGSLGGLAAGRLLARAAAGAVGTAASEMWLTLDVADPLASGRGTIAGLVVGLGMALAAAYLAIRATFAAPTVEALRPAGVAFERPPRRLRALAIAAALIGATWTIALVPPTHGWLVVAVIIGSQLAAYVGAAVVSPALVTTAGQCLRGAAMRAYRLPLSLAVDNLPRTPGRSGMTVVTITAAIGMLASLGGFVQSFENAWTAWAEQHFAADLFVGGGARLRLQAGPAMAPEVRDAVAAVDGVASVEPLRILRVRQAGQPVFLQGIAIEERLRHGGLPMVEGDLAAAAARLADGTGVLLSDNLAYRRGLHRGAEIALATARGARTFRVEGTFVDYLGSLDQGAIAVDTRVLGALWDDRAANLLRVWLRPGEEASAVRRRVQARLGQGFFVITAGQFLDGVRYALDQVFVATWALVIVAMAVSVIGVVNAQLAAVIDRAPELCMLRAIGVSARDLTRAVVLECGALGLVGGLFGLALGSMLSEQFVTVSMRRLTGWRLPFDLPLAFLLTGVGGAVLVSAAAGWLPARVASRVQTYQHSFD